MQTSEPAHVCVAMPPSGGGHRHACTAAHCPGSDFHISGADAWQSPGVHCVGNVPGVYRTNTYENRSSYLKVIF